jgi:hypothetical protein
MGKKYNTWANVQAMTARDIYDRLDQLRYEHALLLDVVTEVIDIHDPINCVKRRTSFCMLCSAIDKWELYEVKRG